MIANTNTLIEKILLQNNVFSMERWLLILAKSMVIILGNKCRRGCGSVVECDFSIVEARGSIPLISIFDYKWLFLSIFKEC